MKIELVDRTKIRLDHELIWGLVLLALGLGALVVPLERANLACPFKKLTGLACLTCGGTRCLAALRRFDPAGALVANPLIAVLAVLAGVYLLYAWTSILLRTRRIRVRTTRSGERNLLRTLAVAILALNWVYLIAMGR